MNMAFADLLLGPFSVPFYTYQVEHVYQLWTAKYSFYIMVFRCMNAIFVFGSYLSAAIISCERFNAVYWPFKQRLQSTKTFCIAIFLLWKYSALLSTILTLLLVFTSSESALYVAVAVLLGHHMCLQHRDLDKTSTQNCFFTASKQSFAKQTSNKDPTFCFYTGFYYRLASLNHLERSHLLAETLIPWTFYDMVNILNYSNSFVNPVVYAIRIPKFQRALCSCRKRGEQPLTRNKSQEEIERLRLERH